MMSYWPGAYRLPPDEYESRRLNRQHRLWTETLNYLVHPVILSSLPSDSHIAEIATGNGRPLMHPLRFSSFNQLQTRIWILSIARTLPETVKLVGFDICKDQFPEPHAVPKNVSFETQGLLKPFPNKYLGSFDLISVRMIASTLAAGEWESAARNISSLLKPGGYMQWFELDNSASIIFQNTSQARCSSLTLLGRSALSFLHSRGMDPRPCLRLPHIFSSINLIEIQQDIFSSDRDPSLRAEFSDVHARSLLAIMEKAGLEMWEGWNLEKVRELERKVFAQLETEEVYLRCDFYVVIGRAASAPEK